MEPEDRDKVVVVRGIETRRAVEHRLDRIAIEHHLSTFKTVCVRDPTSV